MAMRARPASRACARSLVAAASRTRPPAVPRRTATRRAQAERPVIFGGGGAVGTRQALTDIAERIGAPVLCSNAGKGILPDSHRLSLGCSILQEASRQALG